MNEKNLAALANQLDSIGIENQLGVLIRKICFQPERFVLVQQFTKESDRLSVQFIFEKEANGAYSIAFYEVALLLDISFDKSSLNGVDISALNQEMEAIDWRILFAEAGSEKVRLDDKATWELEARVDKIVTRLQQLASTNEGEVWAKLLKAKFWLPTSVPAVASSLRSEISQRFYPHPGGRNISVDEAWRFLQNKRLERQFQHFRKHKDDQSGREGKKNQLPSKRSKKNNGAKPQKSAKADNS